MKVCSMNNIQMYVAYYTSHVVTVMWSTASVVSLHWQVFIECALQNLARSSRSAQVLPTVYEYWNSFSSLDNQFFLPQCAAKGSIINQWCFEHFQVHRWISCWLYHDTNSRISISCLFWKYNGHSLLSFGPDNDGLALKVHRLKKKKLIIWHKVWLTKTSLALWTSQQWLLIPSYLITAL